MSALNVDIEYCGGWGYGPRYQELAKAIKVRIRTKYSVISYFWRTLLFYFQAEIPSAQVDGHVGRQTSFEVKVNDTEIHSKLKTMAFPDFKEVIQICHEVSKGNAPTQVTKTQSSCVIL